MRCCRDKGVVFEKYNNESVELQIKERTELKEKQIIENNAILEKQKETNKKRRKLIIIFILAMVPVLAMMPKIINSINRNAVLSECENELNKLANQYSLEDVRIEFDDNNIENMELVTDEQNVLNLRIISDNFVLLENSKKLEFINDAKDIIKESVDSFKDGYIYFKGVSDTNGNTYSSYASKRLQKNNKVIYSAK